MMKESDGEKDDLRRLLGKMGRVSALREVKMVGKDNQGRVVQVLRAD